MTLPQILVLSACMVFSGCARGHETTRGMPGTPQGHRETCEDRLDNAQDDAFNVTQLICRISKQPDLPKNISEDIVECLENIRDPVIGQLVLDIFPFDMARDRCHETILAHNLHLVAEHLHEDLNWDKDPERCRGPRFTLMNQVFSLPDSFIADHPLLILDVVKADPLLFEKQLASLIRLRAPLFRESVLGLMASLSSHGHLNDEDTTRLQWACHRLLTQIDGRWVPGEQLEFLERVATTQPDNFPGDLDSWLLDLPDHLRGNALGHLFRHTAVPVRVSLIYNLLQSDLTSEDFQRLRDSQMSRIEKEILGLPVPSRIPVIGWLATPGVQSSLDPMALLETLKKEHPDFLETIEINQEWVRRQTR